MVYVKKWLIDKNKIYLYIIDILMVMLYFFCNSFSDGIFLLNKIIMKKMNNVFFVKIIWM